MISVQPLPIVSYPDGGRSRDYLDASQTGDSMVWDCLGQQFVVFDLVAGAWPASAVLTLEVGLTPEQFSAHPAGAVTYNAVGVKVAVGVAGMAYIRLRVSTTGTGFVRPVAHGYSEN